ncbi:uncharacterized protein LOC141983517 [Natator depressus]|uniref:uncharacterized protein LOC141983517 n=1 Tax=Natator depressus TaxID=27790 RepID=UPI003EB9C23A
MRHPVANPLWNRIKTLTLNFNAEIQWRATWSILTAQNKQLIIDPTKEPSGFDLGQKDWCRLNRIRTSHGRCEQTLFKCSPSPGSPWHHSARPGSVRDRAGRALTDSRDDRDGKVEGAREFPLDPGPVGLGLHDDQLQLPVVLAGDVVLPFEPDLLGFELLLLPQLVVGLQGIKDGGPDQQLKDSNRALCGLGPQPLPAERARLKSGGWRQPMLAKKIWKSSPTRTETVSDVSLHGDDAHRRYSQMRLHSVPGFWIQSLYVAGRGSSTVKPKVSSRATMGDIENNIGEN